MMLSKKDKAVVAAFTDKRTLASERLVTDGRKLQFQSGLGGAIASWRNGKIRFPQAAGPVMQAVQNAVRRNAPKNWLEETASANGGRKALREAVRKDAQPRRSGVRKRKR